MAEVSFNKMPLIRYCVSPSPRLHTQFCLMKEVPLVFKGDYTMAQTNGIPDESYLRSFRNERDNLLSEKVDKLVPSSPLCAFRMDLSEESSPTFLLRSIEARVLSEDTLQ